MKKPIVVLAVAALTGCAPMIKVSTPKTVMLSNVGAHNADQALQMAEAECMKHDRHAVAVPDNIRDGQQQYECKD